ncbi:MAG: hypothetical protein A2X36_07165 [Elusimicrobia bacterium GWA2_69_24]|nr:MAG: hypothetical protein A2X36_07165 [Elusimicrobia bacterium GWA2_69_24]HBL15199.1 hypothetical protein [Elusimicrobiota bacterium]
MPDADERTAFWDRNILRWEAARYSLLSSFNPFAWTVRRRMEAARRLVREDFADHPDVLDLGCGSGILAHALIDREGRSYLGIDISGVAVAAARRRFASQAGRIRFERRDVLAAPAWDASLIVVLGLLDWIDEAEARRLFQRLRGRSLCFSFTETESGGASLLYRQYRRCIDRTYRARDYRQSQVVAAAEEAGYRVDRVLRLSRWDPGRLVLASKP